VIRTIVAPVEPSHRYVTDRFFPDKSIDLIDEASAPQAGDRLQAQSDGSVRSPANPTEERARSDQEGGGGRSVEKCLELIQQEITRIERERASLDQCRKRSGAGR
jgi:ATP-dependent Clp protease ATP-binding subunit ClpA